MLLLTLAYVVGVPVAMLARAWISWFADGPESAVPVAVMHLVISIAAIPAILLWLGDYADLWFITVPGILSAVARFLLESRSVSRS
ncbi:hypothetical protein O7599_33040 [Streptomyces sp. WMMC500]|uniref:hypothetical protein n=1 Tax=Streptomyces sp. WMMC500 TaxID=3015154 RepID=UPI00248AA7CF|nr:hypothetical protein [Streptomyces sp. WMMC500]WBB60292.1 hypothetical protein O7599_33040 [Streptomyces sp. WMMC500]